jgi:hypothetical protein
MTMETIEKIVGYACLGITCYAGTYIFCKLGLYEIFKPSNYNFHFKEKDNKNMNAWRENDRLEAS